MVPHKGPRQPIMGQVRVLTLSYGQDGSSTLYRLSQGWTLRFELGPSLMGKKVTLWTTYPVSETDGGNPASPSFNRPSHHQVPWQRASPNLEDDTALYAGIPLSTSGAFHFCIKEDGREEQCGQGHFIVDPKLTVGPEDEVLPLDGVQCQSVLTKNLGPFNTWESRLRFAKESGYNMIHFTPLQHLGASNSCYSLQSHLNLDPRYGADWDDVDRLVRQMRNSWKVLSICDIVLNHTANESAWIQEHPSSSYNCWNTRNLRPAFIFDQMFQQVTKDIASGLWVDQGVPRGELSTLAHLDTLRPIIYHHYLNPLRLQEFFMLDVEAVVARYSDSLSSARGGQKGEKAAAVEVQILQDPDYRRLGGSVDLDLAYKAFGEDKDNLRRHLLFLNKEAEKKAWDHLNNGVENVFRGAAYERLDPNGPKVAKCNRKNPFSRNYFTTIEDEDLPLSELERLMFTEQAGSKFMAHNGWVMNLDPTVDFTSDKCNVYLRRELIAWGDSVKLNYGRKPEDSPFLWDYMQKYVEKTASTFHGIRLDNCHSTPIHVAEYLLNCARRIRPDLYVIAELFTKSEQFDNMFINRLGISSLIREALSAWDSHEQGRLIHRFGGDPVGAFIQPKYRPLIPSIAHAIFFDQTHDNPSPREKRTVEDALPSSALVNMACCATGSNRGYDELVPHHINVVKETRFYATWADPEADKPKGMVMAKKVMQDLHFYLASNGFNELYVDQMSTDVVAVTRHSPMIHESVVMVASTAFSQHVYYHQPLELAVEGQLMEIVYEASLRQESIGSNDFCRDPEIINGLADYACSVRTHIPIDESQLVRLKKATDERTVVDLHNLQPGSVVAFRFRLPEPQREDCQVLRDLIESQDWSEADSGSSSGFGTLASICKGLNLNDINRILFRCDQEERDASGGNGVYTLNGFVPPYAGLQGFMSLLEKIRPVNDLGNWLPSNLREGNWLMDYIVDRLRDDHGWEASTGCQSFAQWLDCHAFTPLRRIPRYLIPRYFDAIYSRVYGCVLDRAWALMSPLVQDGSDFVKHLALGSLQHGAVVRSAPMPPLATVDPVASSPEGLSLAAGLPHFSTGYMRCWGRDTFISLPGLFILTGRHQEAKAIILSFAGCLRHGLIPNLLDGGRKARFNCRDAFWWWLYCIKVFVSHVPDGEEILHETVLRLFPEDGQKGDHVVVEQQPLWTVIHEGLQKHFKGLRFREWNAGTQIDAHMKNEGFDNEIGVDRVTGFVFGGNIWNCGTWMDKMGSSDKAGNRGKPSTPRDGSAVELVGLSYACLTWLAEENKKGHYPGESVVADDDQETFSLSDWATKIRDNFEDYFYITKASSCREKRPDLINKEHVYKDTVNGGHPWADYQLRCNFPIAMAVAPDLFDPERAWGALQIAKDKLLGPLGMATLDPDDWAYRGDYDNSNDSHDPSVAHGANYHQGPEWVWPVGFFLRAYLIFAERTGGLARRQEAVCYIMSVLSAHYTEVRTSVWRGIPELTNSRGKFCRDSNPTQAWSFATLLEVMAEITHRCQPED